MILRHSNAIAGLRGKRLCHRCFRVRTINAAHRGLSTQCSAGHIFAAETDLAHLLKLALVAVGDFLLDELQHGLGRAFREDLHKIAGIVVDEAAVGRHDDVSQSVVHQVLHGMVAQRFQKPAPSNRLLADEVFKGETAKEDNQLTAEATQFGSFLEILLGVFEEEEDSIQKYWIAVKCLLSKKRWTWASSTSTWKTMLSALKMVRRMLTLKLGKSSSRRQRCSSPSSLSYTSYITLCVSSWMPLSKYPLIALTSPSCPFLPQ